MDKEAQLIEFPASPDFEFGKRQSRICRYKLWAHAPGNGLAVYIPGFGGDLGTYTEAFCRKTANRHRLNTMTVEHFCMHCRPNVGADIHLEQQDVRQVEVLLTEAGLIPTGDIEAKLQALSVLAQRREAAVRISATLRPGRKEYQNFGLLAALDIVEAIRDVVIRLDVDPNDIYLIGSSYGGYLANLATKLFPGAVKAVFDNSSWASPHLRYVVGRELGTPEYLHEILPGVVMGLHVLSPWTLKSGLPNSFDHEKATIRSFSEEQIEQMAIQGGTGTAYVFFHAANDRIADVREKIAMAKTMIKQGFERVQMEIIEPDDVDGVFTKNLEHGMGLSMVEFFTLAHRYVDEQFPTPFISVFPQKVHYLCGPASYRFDYSRGPVTAELLEQDEFAWKGPAAKWLPRYPRRSA